MDNNFGGNFPGKEVTDKMKGPNTHQKEEEYIAKMVHPISSLKFILIVFSILSGCLFYALNYKHFLNITLPIYVYLVPVALTVLSFIFLHPTPLDVWVPHVASSRIGTSYCKICLRCLVIDYDIVNSKKDINKFIEEITDKSEDWNYFIKNISPRTMKIKIKVRPKVKIPNKANFTGEWANNEQWNYIPLGICLTDNSVLGSINWMLNDNNKVKGECKETIPSTSFLVAGGTGSGKSVLENNIIRHCNTFNENFQTMLVDVKRVEFGGLSNLEGVKAVALDIMEAKGCLEASREIMYSRFKFMERSGVNNVYKLKNYKCSYFTIENVYTGYKKLYQFDEIFYSEVNGEVTITTIDELYKKAEHDDVNIYFYGQKEKSLKISRSKEECLKDNNQILYIRELTPGDFYIIGGNIYRKDEPVNLYNSNGEIITKNAEDISDMVHDPKNAKENISGFKDMNKDSLTKDNVKCIECIFKPKAILTVVDEMSEVMSTNNYKAQSSISDSISSIARLGRAAACHLCLAPLPEDLELRILQDRSKSVCLIKEHIDNLNNKLMGEDYILPEYYNNMDYNEIKDQIHYLTNIYYIIKDIPILGERSGYLNIKWENLQLGDIIEDAVVIYIGPWQEKQCVELTASDNTSIEASLDHLFKIDIFSYNDNGIKERMNSSFEHSRSIRNNLKESNDYWISVNDICDSIDKGFEVILPDGNKVVGYNLTKIKRVRCIQTTTGEYSINR